MRNRADGIAELDALGERPNHNLLAGLWNGDFAALRVSNLVSNPACQHLAHQLLASNMAVDHRDVDGLRVIGLSHFQAVRNTELLPRYLDEARTSAGMLRTLASPFASPFDSAVALLAHWWPAGCQFTTLPSEGLLSPFTVRIYSEGVGIEPHQDILSAESPNDPAANSIGQQFGANIYLSMGTGGGVLELFATDYAATTYRDLDDGPQVVSRDTLPDPSVSVAPSIGDLIIFPSYRIHAVTASAGAQPRITISFFVGVQNDSLPLKLWA
jgi:hypothetical protein